MTNRRGDRRRRLAKACNACRKSKVRCDGSRPVCGRCRSSGNECCYADVDKPDIRQRRSNRLSQNLSAISSTQEGLGQIHTISALSVNSHDSPTEVWPEEIPDNHLNQSTLAALDISPRDEIVGGDGDMRYFGPPSGISLISMTSQRKPEQKSSESWSQWTHPSIEAIFEKRVTKPLPSWMEAFSLVSEFFSHEHPAFPCFNPPAFMSLLGQQYSGNVPATESPAWRVSLNAVLAIAQRRRAETTQSQEAEDLAWGYAANSLNATWEVLMRSTKLSSVQALLSIAWFFLETPNPQPSFMLIGCAMRLAHSIGLHTNSNDPSWSPTDIYTRKKVIWVAICLDRELCLRTGRPPCHDLYGSYIDPPMDSLDGTEIVTTLSGFRVNLFKAQVQLAVHQSLIYQELHSSESPLAGIPGSISTLVDRLGKWCAEFAPSLFDNSVQYGEHYGLMRLYFSYYNAIIITNRSHSFSYWVSSNQPDLLDLSPDIKSSISECLNASRSVLGLSRLIPDKSKSLQWGIIPMLIGATAILCTNTLRNPISNAVEEDMHCVRYVVHIIDSLEEVFSNTYLAQVRKVYQELYRTAQQAIHLSKGKSDEGNSQNKTNPTPQGSGATDVFDLNLGDIEQVMPNSLPLSWDFNIPFWASFS